MYLDTTILQSKTTTTLVEFIEEIIGVDGDSLTAEQLHNFNEIKKQFRKAKKLDSRGKSLSQE